MPKTRIRLLLVVADEVLAEITGFRLELLGYEVRVAHSGEQALIDVKQQVPDLCIIELKLPVMSGTALMEQLASDETTSGMPMLALSFDAEVEHVQSAFTAGATDFLVAPYDPLVLEDKVETLLAARVSPRPTDNQDVAQGNHS